LADLIGGRGGCAGQSLVHCAKTVTSFSFCFRVASKLWKTLMLWLVRGASNIFYGEVKRRVINCWGAWMTACYEILGFIV